MQPLPDTVREAFTQVFRENRWQNAESVSGSGSTRAATAELIPQLANLITRYRIESLVDAPCGDFNWIRPIAGMVRYRGFDVVEEVVEIARSRGDYPFEQLDIVEAVLPRADAILCRDCLVHLPQPMIERAVSNMVSSGSTYLITTTFPDLDRNAPIAVGRWRPINLEIAPFDLPPPQETIFERPSLAPHPKYGRKALGAWRLADLSVPD